MFRSAVEASPFAITTRPALSLNNIHYNLSTMPLRLTCLMCWIFCYITCVKGAHRVVCPSQTVLATVGDTVFLPCRIELPVSATDLTTEWSRTDLKPEYVYIHRNGHAEEDRNLNELYRGQRCSVSEEKLAGGDLSLELRGVQFSDDGTYRCKVPDPHTDLDSRSCVIKLRIGNVSQPEIYSVGPKDNKDIPLISGVDAGLPGHIIAAIVIVSLCAVRALIFMATVGWNWQKNLQRGNWENNLQRDAEAVDHPLKKGPEETVFSETAEEIPPPKDLAG